MSQNIIGMKNSKLRVVHKSLIHESVLHEDTTFLKEVLEALTEKYKKGQSLFSKLVNWVRPGCFCKESKDIEAQLEDVKDQGTIVKVDNFSAEKTMSHALQQLEEESEVKVQSRQHLNSPLILRLDLADQNDIILLPLPSIDMVQPSERL